MAGYLAGDVDEWLYIDIADQHPDSIRFIRDCEAAIGQEIQILRSKEYSCVEDCVKVFGGFRAPNGFAPCTNWLKKRVRKEWELEHQRYDLTYVWGFDLKERDRADRTIEANSQAEHELPRGERLPRPVMYDMGYPNNNCLGCTKGGMGYWNKIRRDFPAVFESRARLERQIGYAILKDSKGKPVYLDDLDPSRGNMNTEVFPDCGIMCYLSLEK